MPQLWVLAGGNGSGKSTFYEQFLKPTGIPFVNADLLAQALFPEDPEGKSYKAARRAEVQRESMVSQGATFCFETVFSHESKIDFMAAAKARGYQVILVYIHLAHSSLNVARVAQRVGEGGHSVPEQKIHERIPRTMSNVRAALALCDLCRFYDNSSAESPLLPVAEYGEGVFHWVAQPAPEWFDFFV